MAHGVSAAQTPVVIYGSAEIASLLGVNRSAVTNWHNRDVGAPAPDFITPDGRRFWLSLEPWERWWELRQRLQHDE